MNQTFTNAPVPPEALPDYASVPLHPVAPGYRRYAVLSSLVFWAVVVALALVFGDRIGLPVWVPAAAGGIGALAVASAWLEARRRGWAVREHDLIYRRGLLVQRTVIVPFARIQHVETASGPLERVFRLLRVRCYTAGGAEADLDVLGLNEAQAMRLRQHLLEQVRTGDGAGAAPHDGLPQSDDG